jgi:hypothetical protein
MSGRKLLVRFCLPLVLLLSASVVQAVTLYVNCGERVGLTTVGAALNKLKHIEAQGPHTINVSGVCNEDVVIQSIDHLTLNAVNGASINDPSQGANVTLTIDDSRDVGINNFVINGYAAGNSGNDVVDCLDASICRFSGTTVQNSPQGAGIGVFSGSYADIEGGVLQNNAWTGLLVIRSARARAFGVTTLQNGHGAVVGEGGILQLANSTSTNNMNFGIQIRQGGYFTCQTCNVIGNSGYGINAEENAVVTFHGGSVTGNGGVGINLTNLSSASFDGTETVTNNDGGQGDIVCNPKYTTTHGLPGTVGVVVNCP